MSDGYDLTLSPSNSSDEAPRVELRLNPACTLRRSAAPKRQAANPAITDISAVGATGVIELEIDLSRYDQPGARLREITQRPEAARLAGYRCPLACDLRWSLSLAVGYVISVG